MLDKLHKQHSTHSHYMKPKSQARKAFGIVHFAGIVYYDAKEFLEKNRDTFSADLFDLLHRSKSKFLIQLFTGERAMVMYSNTHNLLTIMTTDYRDTQEGTNSRSPVQTVAGCTHENSRSMSTILCPLY